MALGSRYYNEAILASGGEGMHKKMVAAYERAHELDPGLLFASTELVSGRCATRSDAIGFASCDLVDGHSGKILVLDTVSAQILVPTGKAVFSVLVIVEANDVSGVAREVEYHLPVSLIGSPAFGDIPAFAGPLTLYAIGNNSVFAEVFTDDTSQSSEIFFSFSGHLVTP